MTEIPYQVNKAALITRIAELVQDKTIDGISDIRDESDKSGMRIVIELKRTNANVVLNRLYKHTQMQDVRRDHAGAGGWRAARAELKELLHYIEHQKDVIVRRTRFDRSGRKRGRNILEGLIIALDNTDEIVELIKKSPDVPSERRADGAVRSDRQAGAGDTDMRLQRLTGLERTKIIAEYEKLLERIAYLKRYWRRRRWCWISSRKR